MNSLKVASVALDIVWTDIEENLFATENIIHRLDKDVDLLVLPELFTTGFISSASLLIKFAEPEDSGDSLTLRKVKEWAAKYNMAIAGSYLSVSSDGRFHNRGFLVEPSGETTFYIKKHLFSLSSEAENFAAGTDTIPVIRFRGWNIALAICYDLRFPAWLRNRGAMYDVLILPANWPARRAYAWEHLLIARAIENQAYVVGANRSGSDDSGPYGDNKSFILNYVGKSIGEVCAHHKNVLTATLDRDRLLAYRSSFPALNDADNFSF